MSDNNEYIYVECEKLFVFKIKRKLGSFKPMRVPCPADCPKKKDLICRKTYFFVNTYSSILTYEPDKVDFIFDSTVDTRLAPKVSEDSTRNNDCFAISEKRRRVPDNSRSQESENSDVMDIENIFGDLIDSGRTTTSTTYQGHRTVSKPSSPQSVRTERSPYGFEASREDFSANSTPGWSGGVARSIFANLKPLKGMTCFTAGGYNFSVEHGVGNSAGGPKEALDYIFYHWLTTAVFQKDEVTFKNQFLWLLKYRGLDKHETELVNIAQNRKLTVNQKFFRVFYNVIFVDKNVDFYWQESSSPLNQITPRFHNREEFFHNMLRATSPSKYMQEYKNCMYELCRYLAGSQCPSEEDLYPWFKEHVTMKSAADEKQVVLVNGEGGALEIHILGSIIDFVNGMSVFEKKNKTRINKLNFLREYCITPSYHVQKRNSEFMESVEVGDSDDECVYRGIGIPEEYSSVYATVYNQHVSVLLEYMRTFKPTQIEISKEPFNLILTRNGFKSQIETIVWDAGQYLEDDMQAWRRHIEVVKYYVVRSLIIRGVFNEYLERGEYKNLDRFVERYFRAGQLNRRGYFALPAKRNSPHMVTYNHKTETIQKYIEDRLVNDAIADQEWLTGDRIVADYIEARREDSAIDNNIQKTKKRIHDAITQYESIAREGE